MKFYQSRKAIIFSLAFLVFLVGLALTFSMGSLFSKNSRGNLPDGLYGVFKTDKGEIVVRLEYEKAPLTVANFVGLAEGKINSVKNKEPFYDGLTFHRVVADFVIQGGDPLGNGTGGPGYSFSDEFHPDLKHSSEGILSMANSGPNSNGSQFFITLSPTPWLDDKHSVFGKVVEGIEVVKEIMQGDAIQGVEIIKKGKDAEKFNVDQKFFDDLERDAREEFKNKNQLKINSMLEKFFPAGNYQEGSKGIYYEILREGSGSPPEAGKKVVVHYLGKLTDGTEFDSSYKRGETFSFTLGEGRVIQGWEETLKEMKKGEKRVVLLPPSMAYGGRGIGVIPPNSYLVFEIELLDF